MIVHLRLSSTNGANKRAIGHDHASAEAHAAYFLILHQQASETWNEDLKSRAQDYDSIAELERFLRASLKASLSNFRKGCIFLEHSPLNVCGMQASTFAVRLYDNWRR